MMLRKSLIFVIVILSHNLIAQVEIMPGPDLVHKKGVHLFKVIGQDENSFYSVWIDPNGKKGNDEYYLESYDLKSLALQKSTIISMENDEKDQTVLSDVYFLDGKIIVLSELIKFKNAIYYAQVLNTDGKVEKPVFVFQSLQRVRGDGFDLQYDSGRKAISLVASHFDNNARSKDVKIFDPVTFEEVHTVSFPFAFIPEEESWYSGFHFEPDKTFHYVCINNIKRDEKKRKVKKQRLTLVYKKQGKSEKEVVIGPDTVSYSSVLDVYDPSENVFVVSGFMYKRKNPYAFAYKIDAATGNILKSKEQPLDFGNGKMDWKTTGSGTNGNLAFDCKGLFYTSGIARVVGEQYLLITTSSSGSTLMNPSANYFDLVIGCFDFNADTSAWIDFSKREYLKARVACLSPSNYIYTDGADLKIAYLDSPVNLKVMENPAYKADDLEKVVEHNNSTFVMATVNKRNEVKRVPALSKEGGAVQMKCRIAPNYAGNMYFNFLLLELKDKSMLIYLEDENTGKWAIAKNL